MSYRLPCTLAINIVQATSFNQTLDNWDVALVDDMSHMFSEAKSFNQPIGGWNTGNVALLIGAFEGASSFDQDIGGMYETQVALPESSKITQCPHGFFALFSL